MFDIEFFKDWKTINGIFHNPNDKYIGNCISSGGVWEYYLHPYLKTNKLGDILDIGANIGCHSIYMAEQNPDKTIHCFEPQQYQFFALNTNIINKKLYNVKTYQLALGSKKDTARFPNCYSTPGYKNFGGASLIPNYHGVDDSGKYHPEIEGHDHILKTKVLSELPVENSGEIVNIVTLDSLQIPKVSLMKVDVEGYEQEFLQGAKQTILRDKPDIIIEIHKDLNEMETKLTLKELGYHIEHIPNAPVWDYFCKAK